MKKMLCGVFTACLMIGTASAATEIQENDAVSLDQLGLFRGTEQGYELDRTITRERVRSCADKTAGRRAGSPERQLSNTLYGCTKLGKALCWLAV